MDGAIDARTRIRLAVQFVQTGLSTDIFAFLGGMWLGRVKDADGYTGFTRAGLMFRCQTPPTEFAVDNVEVTREPA